MKLRQGDIVKSKVHQSLTNINIGDEFIFEGDGVTRNYGMYNHEKFYYFRRASDGELFSLHETWVEQEPYDELIEL